MYIYNTFDAVRTHTHTSGQRVSRLVPAAARRADSAASGTRPKLGAVAAGWGYNRATLEVGMGEGVEIRLKWLKSRINTVGKMHRPYAQPYP